MSAFLRNLLISILHLGYLGPLLMGVLDSSFLFLPFGNDLLIVILTARHHARLPIFVLTAATGSTIGVFLLNIVAAKSGEAGLRRMTRPKRFEYLKRKIADKGGRMIAVGCLAPPPFPFTLLIAAASAFGFPRIRLLRLVFICRCVRFALLGWLAIVIGDRILRIVQGSIFFWTMVVFIALCAAGSAVSIAGWIRRSRSVT